MYVHIIVKLVVCVSASPVVPWYMSFSPSDLLDRRLDASCRLHSAQFMNVPTSAARSRNVSAGSHEAPTTSTDALRHELSLLHAELMFEKQRREVHARRGRRLLDRVNHLNSLADQNEAMVIPYLPYLTLHVTA